MDNDNTFSSLGSVMTNQNNLLMDLIPSREDSTSFSTMLPWNSMRSDPLQMGGFDIFSSFLTNKYLSSTSSSINVQENFEVMAPPPLPPFHHLDHLRPYDDSSNNMWSLGENSGFHAYSYVEGVVGPSEPIASTFAEEDVSDECSEISPYAATKMTSEQALTSEQASSSSKDIYNNCVKQAIILFIHNKLSINPDHRFAFATLSKSAAWLKKDFTSDAASAIASLRGLSATKSSGRADLTQLFRVAAHEAKISRAQNRILRVILIYCRSSVRPTHEWPLKQKLFTLDVMYLHDKPSPDNCPQDVYDSLVDAVERVSEYEGYIFESGQGLARSVFKPMSILLSHPQQRCAQDDLDIPKSLAKKVPVVEAASVDDNQIPQAMSQ
ncbi:hypothetical protein DY000_02027783 [Brassica cretica]|uniref:BRISC and BRCA1-A complex member 1 n=1 Tax=Brassica cretica TaxID=69181 RepID=A0ABQ7EIZ9_BRACR|nr:hypothetical protein DY000_02027783 [Brassica cretica]